MNKLKSFSNRMTDNRGYHIRKAIFGLIPFFIVSVFYWQMNLEFHRQIIAPVPAGYENIFGPRHANHQLPSTSKINDWKQGG